MTPGAKKLQIQEDQYNFPYHYLDLASDEFRLIWYIPYLSKLDLIKEYFQKNHYKTLLDVGSGDGRLIYHFNDIRPKAVGVDFSKQAIKFAQVFNPWANFIVTDILEYHPGHKFDLVTCVETVEHIPLSQVKSVIKKLSSLVSPKGSLIITVPSTNLPLLSKHFQHFSSSQLEKLLDPYFHQVQIIGHDLIGTKKLLYIIFRMIGLFLYPFRTRLKFTTSIYHFLNRYFRKHLNQGLPNQALDLIVICSSPKKILRS